MGNEPVINLDFLRNDGKRESTKLTRHNLFQAHQVAEQLLRRGAGLYTEVDIRLEDRWIETIERLDLVASSLDKGR